MPEKEIEYVKNKDIWNILRNSINTKIINKFLMKLISNFHLFF